MRCNKLIRVAAKVKLCLDEHGDAQTLLEALSI